MSATFNPAAVKHAPWSMSKAAVAISCPFRHRLKYIDKVKGKEAAASSASRIGIATHEALEWVLKGKHNLKEALRRSAIKTMLTSPEMDEVFALTHNLQLFLERLEKFKKKHKVEEQRVELKFGLTQNFEQVPFFDKSGALFFRGVWDLCLRTPEKYLIIVDHKSGAVKELSEHQDQLRVYMLAGLYIFPGVVGVQPAIHYMQDDSGLHWDKLQSAERIREEILPWFADYLNKAGNCAEQTDARKGRWCAFCEHTERCPLKK
jgi:hypothetical protein